MYSRVAEKTGYTASMVGKVLNGKAELTERFTQLVCRAFDIDRTWVEEGRGEAPSAEGATGATQLLEAVPGLVEGLKDQAVIEGVKELLKMPEPDRWEAVGMLKRMNQVVRH